MRFIHYPLEECTDSVLIDLGPIRIDAESLLSLRVEKF